MSASAAFVSPRGVLPNQRDEAAMCGLGGDGNTALQTVGRGHRTLNSFRDALHTFLGFCKQQRWIEENPIAQVPKARSGGVKKRPRRAYTLKEFKALLHASKHHRFLYFVAGFSGLRKKELRLLEKRDLTPIGDRPT